MTTDVPGLKNLRNKAATSTKARNHRMRWGKPVQCVGGWMQIGSCRDCTKSVTIKLTEPMEIDCISGLAVTEKCIPSLHFLDRHIRDQAARPEHRLISAAADAEERFGVDECERYATSLKK